MRIIFTLCFMLISLSLFSAKIIITGDPVELEVHEGYFTLPENYTYEHEYHYAIVSGTERVCYMKPISALAAVDVIQIIIEEDEKKLNWFCYAFDKRFFEVDF